MYGQCVPLTHLGTPPQAFLVTASPLKPPQHQELTARASEGSVWWEAWGTDIGGSVWTVCLESYDTPGHSSSYIPRGIISKWGGFINEESLDISLPLNASSLLTPDLTLAIQAFVSETTQGHFSLRQGCREWDYCLR